MKPNIKDIARLAGVSSTTVSRVLNNRGYISIQTREKVQKAIKKLNYHPNDLARSLYHKHTYFIGLIFPTTANPFFGELVSDIENECASQGYKVFLCNSLGRADKEIKYLNMLQRNQVDGIIVGAHNRNIPEYRQANLPIVAIDRYLSNKIPVISSDNFLGGKLATNWLLEQGCRNIIHICGPHELETPANRRRDGYEEVMRSAGKKPIIYELAEMLPDNRTDVVRRVFTEQPEVDGIFASDDLIAATVLSESKKYRRLNCNHIKVVGYDGTETVRTCLPQLTTIEQPIHQIAWEAVRILLSQINGEFQSSDNEILLPIKLVVGTP
ncbi:LacI family DNA-binding transcriptional regulator [Sporolactobacillus vineae]|uniref:LacI family DNA-binding transcriptional regulator n=1 Tax=Sporolactobacillus vineae TaxID=444463 RepID=UPI000287CFB2|nr:LacI family DNA-binding transcriptional regulator [Sporolactobacillus vineae]